MNTENNTRPVQLSKGRLWIGWILTALPSSLALVGAGHGVSLVAESGAVAGSALVSCVPLRDPEILVEVGLIWRRENMSPLIRRFIEYAVLLGQEIEAERAAKLVA